MPLDNLKDNWDGYGSPTPAKALLMEAQKVLARVNAEALQSGLGWEEPHVGINEHGQVTLEWWKETRSLTIFIRAEDRIEYLKAWGSNIEAEMEDGELNRSADFAALSHWLYAENSGSK